MNRIQRLSKSTNPEARRSISTLLATRTRGVERRLLPLLLALACATPSALAHAEPPAAVKPSTSDAASAAPTTAAASAAPTTAAVPTAPTTAAVPTAPTTATVPASVLAMQGQLVVLKTKANLPVTGRLISATDKEFVIDQGTGTLSTIARSELRSVRLSTPDDVTTTKSLASRPAAAPIDRGAGSVSKAETPPNYEYNENPHRGDGTIAAGNAFIVLGLIGALGSIYPAAAGLIDGNVEMSYAALGISGGSLLLTLIGVGLKAAGRDENKVGRAYSAGGPFLFRGLSIAPPMAIAGHATPAMAVTSWAF